MTTATAGSHLRRRIMMVVRLVVVPVALVVGWFLARSSGLDLRPAGGPAPLLIALAINQLAIILIGWRMAVGLRLFGIELRFLDALRIAIQSQFYFFFVPVSASNEVSRYLKIKAIHPGVGLHVLIVALLFDRLTGVLACIAIALAALPFLHVDPAATLGVPTWGALGIVAGLSAVVTLLAWRFGWHHKLAEAWRGTRGRRGLIVPAALLVIVMQASTILAVWFAARWLGVDVSMAALAFGISIGTLGQIVPITFAGAGPAEVAGVAAYLALGFSAPEAGTLAALVYLTRLMAAVEGGVWEMLDGVRAVRRRAEVPA